MLFYLANVNFNCWGTFHVASISYFHWWNIIGQKWFSLFKSPIWTLSVFQIERKAFAWFFSCYINDYFKFIWLLWTWYKSCFFLSNVNYLFRTVVVLTARQIHQYPSLEVVRGENPRDITIYIYICILISIRFLTERFKATVCSLVYFLGISYPLTKPTCFQNKHFRRTWKWNKSLLLYKKPVYHQKMILKPIFQGLKTNIHTVAVRTLVA